MSCIATPAVVLDTNVVLDWLVFADPGVVALASAIATGTVRWVACLAMRDELARTLVQPAIARRSPGIDLVLERFDRDAGLHGAPPAAPAPLRCSDPDDQVFVDLALAAKARWLLTHDRALLRLARRARARGLQIVAPARWPPASR